MSILITGSSGYFGRIVGRDLVSKGYSVIGIDIRENREKEDVCLSRYYKCNITDKKRLKEIFLEEQPDVVLHFACTFNKVRNRKREYETDVGGSVNILELSNETPSVKKLIYSSSAAIYGADDRNCRWLSETTPVNPGKYRYGLNKHLIEQAFFSSVRRADLHIVSLRICTVLGPCYAKPYSVVSLLIRMPFLPDSFRTKKVQFMHEEDFISLIREVIRDEEIEGIYNFASDTCSVVGEVVNGKKYFNLSLGGLKPLLWILWNMRLVNLQPVSLKYCLYPVLVDPARIVERYGYTFKYSSSESFITTAGINCLPAGALF